MGRPNPPRGRGRQAVGDAIEGTVPRASSSGVIGHLEFKGRPTEIVVNLFLTPRLKLFASDGPGVSR